MTENLEPRDFAVLSSQPSLCPDLTRSLAGEERWAMGWSPRNVVWTLRDTWVQEGSKVRGWAGGGSRVRH